MTLAAFDRDDNQIKQGDMVVNFRGEAYTFVAATRAREFGRDGKVYVERNSFKTEFYAGVFDLLVKEVPPPPKKKRYAISDSDSSRRMKR